MRFLRRLLVSLALVCAVSSSPVWAGHGGGRHHASTSTHSRTGVTHVRGYYRKDGTYVRPHLRHLSSTPLSRSTRSWSNAARSHHTIAPSHWKASSTRSISVHRTRPPTSFYGLTRDSHGRFMRSESAKRAFERRHPCPSTGKTYGPCPGYVIDHVRALKHGGADSPDNMQWQTTAEAKAKDKWE